jgi:thiazolinyl imide reductase
MDEPKTPLRVVVAGTGFGRVYVDAITSAPDRYTLVGLLARGGDYSREYARLRGVPLFTDVDQLPDDVDVACVVVGSGVNGGPGSELACSLLRRGVHVLQEHPVHATEIASNAKAAGAARRAYLVNTLYPHLAPVRQFLAAAAVLRSQQRLLFVDAACNSQVACPMVDIIGRVLGGLHPWEFGRPQDVDETLRPLVVTAQPFRTLHAVLGGVPVTLRVQNQVHPEDPDNHAILLHRISIGCEAGVLALADTHGPVLWHPRMHAGRGDGGRLVLGGQRSDRLDTQSTVVLGEQVVPTYREIYGRLWPEAIRHALDELADRIERPAARARDVQWAMDVSSVWVALTDAVGLPELIRPPDPRPVPVSDLVDAVAAMSC